LGKSQRTDKEYTREQRLIKENRLLKRELGYLRKQISRLDLDKYETITKMCFDYEESERIQEELGDTSSTAESLKKDWSCHECSSGYLEIFLYSKLGETWYYRRCNGCSHRTKGKRYTAQVKGILHK
jgi:hypothetical protein